MMDGRRMFGNSGEALAAAFLQDKGYKILATQYRSKFGEIDLIAKDGDEIVFVEVKTRKNAQFGYPEESVTASKRQRILLSGERYLREQRFGGSYRIDVIAILVSGGAAEIVHFENVE